VIDDEWPTQHLLGRTHALAVAVSGLYGVFVLVSLVDVGMVLRTAPAILDVAQTASSKALIEDFTTYFTTTYTPKIVLSIAALGVYLAWLQRAYRNIAEVLGGVPSTNASMTAVFHFVPFAQLYVPYKHVKEAWDAAEPSPRAFLLAWWVLCVASVVTLRYSGMAMSDRVIMLAVMVFNAMTDLGASAMTALLVQRLTRAQQRAADSGDDDILDALS